MQFAVAASHTHMLMHSLAQYLCVGHQLLPIKCNLQDATAANGWMDAAALRKKLLERDPLSQAIHLADRSLREKPCGIKICI